MGKPKGTRNVDTVIKDMIPSELELDDLGLSKEELLFIGFICIEGFHRPGEAYKKAYKRQVVGEMSDSQARSRGLRVMGEPRIREAVQRFVATVLDPFKERFQMQQLQFWQARAFWNPRDIFDENGEIKPLKEIPDESLMALDGIKVDYRGKDADRKIIAYSMASRSEAMKQLQDFVVSGKATGQKKENETRKQIHDVLKEGKEALKKGANGGGLVVERVTERITTNKRGDSLVERHVNNTEDSEEE